MKIFHLILIVTLLIVAMPAAAQVLPGYLTDKGDGALRVEFSGLDTPLPPQTFWEKLWALVGARSNKQYKPEIGTTFTVQSSAYAPSPYQTDATPCTTAVGTKVRPGVVASNFLPIGTVLDINGEKFIVEDRMNARYDGYFMDIWFPSTSQALEFGRKNLKVVVTGYAEPGTNVRSTASPSPSPDATAQGGDTRITQANQGSFWSSVRNTVGSLARFIGAKVSPSVNRYDVDCLSQ